MRIWLLAAFVAVVGWAVDLAAGEAPYVLKDRSPDVVGMEFSVDPNDAYLTACEYGLDPDRGEVFVALRHDSHYGLHWEVGYSDWAKYEGINAYLIDAHSGAVVDVAVTTKAHKKRRYEFEIDPAAAMVDSVPPSAPAVRFGGARRGYYPTGPCVVGGEVMSARVGLIEIYVLDIRDEQSRTRDMGLLLEPVGGEHPLPVDWEPQIPVYPHIKFHKDSLMVYVTWDDGNDEYQEPIHQRFAAYAVDSAGNRSLEPDTLEVILPERVVYEDR